MESPMVRSLKTSSQKRSVPSAAPSFLGAEEVDTAPIEEAEAVPPDEEGAISWPHGENIGPESVFDASRRSGLAETERHDPICFGEPALVQEEDAARYAAMSNQINAAISPKDFVDALLARDVVDLSWEAFRLRRMKTTVLSGGDKPRSGDNERSAPSNPELQSMEAKEASEPSATPSPTFDLDYYERLERLEFRVLARRRKVLREIFQYRELVETDLGYDQDRLAKSLDGSARESNRRHEAAKRPRRDGG